MSHMSIALSGLNCMGCARKVERSLNEHFSVNITALSPTSIELDSDASFSDIEKVISELGYHAGNHQTYQLQGLHCGNCVKKLTNALNDNGNVAIEQITTERLAIYTLLSEAELIAIVQKVGYQASSESAIEPTVETATDPATSPPEAVKKNIEQENTEQPNTVTRLLIDGMTCASCVSSVEKAIKQVNGVVQAQVNLAEQSASVYSSTPLDTPTLLKAISDAGYKGALVESPERQQQQINEQYQSQIKKHRRSAFAGLALGVPLMAWSVLGGSMAIESRTDQLGWGLIAILSLVLLMTAGSDFFRNAVKSLQHKRATMDTLVALGTGAAWLYSTMVVIAPDWFPEQARHVYFEASCMIIGLISLGHTIETKAKIKTTQSLQSLIDLQPKSATQILADGEQVIPVDQITQGMILRIKAGEQLPIDGVIVNGESYINESMLTGEPIPAFKTAGDSVAAGTLNQDGSLVIKATGVGSETMLAKIIELVRRAQSSKPAIARLADSISAVFVPVVVGIALAAAAIWYFWGPDPKINYMLVVMTTVLIIACPCALGLATPLSVTVGIGKAAEMGILIRDAQVLQTAKKIDTVVFDKTGTLTQGHPEVQAFHPYGNERNILSLLFAVERQSDHPIAKAICNYATHLDIEAAEIGQVNTVRGRGMNASHKDKIIQVGSINYLSSLNIDTNLAEEQLKTMEQNAWTPVAIAIDGQLKGLIGVSDPIKQEAKVTISSLKSLGIETIMLTGDHQAVADSIARQLGIDLVIAEVFPDEKSDKIKALQAQGKIVAMVGDGINDAPALSQADLSLAMGGGSDIAIESAQITLLNSSPLLIVNTIELSKATVKNIQQNLLGAFIYNIIGIPVAAGVLFPWFGFLLNPMVAGAAMALSSITVVSNANRLRLFKPSSK